MRINRNRDGSTSDGVQEVVMIVLDLRQRIAQAVEGATTLPPNERETLVNDLTQTVLLYMTSEFIKKFELLTGENS